MKIIKTISNKVKQFVENHGGVLPKIFVWIYASIFIGCGLVTIFGVLYEFCVHGAVNYTAVNDFVKEYFAPSICGTFAILGVLLIDKDENGVPDEWEKKVEDDKNMSDRR